MIVRTEKKSNYTVLPNAFLLDETISDKARGTLVRLLSRPDNWNLNVNYLVKTGKDGHTAIRSAIRELEAAGYIRKDVSRHENGRILGVEYVIHDSPVLSGGEVNSCGGSTGPDRYRNLPAEKTMPGVVQGELFDECPCASGASGGDREDIPCITENHMRETVIKETAPVINTDIKQILRVTTTTTQAQAIGPKPIICDHAVPVPLPSSSSHLDILNLIPEKHKSPMVVSLVNKAMVDYPAREVEEAIVYTAGNVRGGSMQFKAYLDKTLKNKWAVGYLDSMGSSMPCQHGRPWASSWSHPMAKYPNGTVTGTKAMDTNCMVAAEFLMDMGFDLDQMCAEA